MRPLRVQTLEKSRNWTRGKGITPEPCRPLSRRWRIPGESPAGTQGAEPSQLYRQRGWPQARRNLTLQPARLTINRGRYASKPDCHSRPTTVAYSSQRFACPYLPISLGGYGRPRAPFCVITAEKKPLLIRPGHLPDYEKPALPDRAAGWPLERGGIAHCADTEGSDPMGTAPRTFLQRMISKTLPERD